MIKTEQIIEREKMLLKAMKDNDLRVLNELLHDDLLFIIPNGQVITKEMDLDNFRLGNITFHLISTIDQVIKIIDDNAIVTVIQELKGKFLENDFEGRFRYIRVWKLFGKNWKVIAGSGIQLS